LDEQTVTASSLNCFRGFSIDSGTQHKWSVLDWSLKTLEADLAQMVRPRPVSDLESHN